MADRIQQVLQDCIELLRQGVSPEECLARYPEYAQELEPLLRTALNAQGELTPGMPPAARTRARARVLAVWDHRHLPRQRRWGLPFFLPRWAAMAVSVVLAIVLGGVGTVAAAGGAVPGDPLYPVKEIREGAQLWFARSPETKVAMYTRLVKERAEELRELAAKGRTGPSSIALARLERHVEDVNQLVEESIERPADGPPEIAPGLLGKLQEVIAEQLSAEGVVQETLEEAPVEARPGLQRALEAIQRGRDRVRDALEAAGHPIPAEPSPLQSDDNRREPP